MKSIPSIILPIIKEDDFTNKDLFNVLKNKKVIIFGVPGAFTPTCSEKHFPGFIQFYETIKEKGIDEIYCLSINDPFVMKSWLLCYEKKHKILGIADGNGDLTKLLQLTTDKSSNFMGIRCKRFAMIVENNIIIKKFVEKAGKLDVSSAENMLNEL
jgi:glutaredoxin/glutathione-dependent peroxiredoxin